MKIYLVGGAVRDLIMGVTPKDRDYVVVGSTPEEMISLGYHPVGADFPVFLHPQTFEEYALARTELKDGNGYKGFKVAFGPEVTLEDDLSRRDLTVNSIAMDSDGFIIDPFNGAYDIKHGILRPTSEAFKDDPVRVLRAARFLARYPWFTSSKELDLMVAEVYDSGELNHLVPERVWSETVRALGESTPSRYFEFLCGMGIFPEIDAFRDVEEHNKWHPEYDVFTHIMLSINYAAKQGFDTLTRFGVLCHDLGKPAAYTATGGLKSTSHESLGVPIAKSLCERLKVPSDYAYMAMRAAEFHTHVHLSFEMRPSTILKLFKKFKSREWFMRLLNVAESDKRGRGAPACDWVYTQPLYMIKCWNSYEETDTKAITSVMEPGPKVGEAITRAQIKSIAAVDTKLFDGRGL